MEKKVLLENTVVIGLNTVMTVKLKEKDVEKQKEHVNGLEKLSLWKMYASVHGKIEIQNANKDNVVVGKKDVMEKDVKELIIDVNGLDLKLQHTLEKNVTGNLMVNMEEDINVVITLKHVKMQNVKLLNHVNGKDLLLVEESLKNVKLFKLQRTVELENVVNI